MGTSCHWLKKTQTHPNTVGPCTESALGSCTSCILDLSDYFSGLEKQAKLVLQSGMKFKSYGRRQILYREGAPSKYLFLLIAGEIKIYKSLPDGRQQIHKLASIPGDLIACEDLFIDNHSSTAETLTDTKLCHIEKDYLYAIVQQHSEISETLLQSMARNLNSYVQHISNLGQKKASERLASYLIFLQETHQERHLRHGVLIESLTRAELAELLGVTQRTLIRSLKSLESRKVISLAKDGFIILDMPALTQIGDAR